MRKRQEGDRTHFTQVDLQMTKAETLSNYGLAAGSKKRLKSYMDNLSVTRGVKPIFDDQVKDLIMQYALHPEKLKKELSYLNNLCDDEGYQFSRSLKVYTMSEEAFRKFSESNYSNFGWNRNYQNALEVLLKWAKQLKLEPLRYKSDDDISSALPKAKTHSGFYYIQGGNKYKGDNMVGAYSMYQEEEKFALENGTFNTPILVGNRTQASGEYEDNGMRTGKCKHKLRVVSMVSLPVIIAEMKFAIPFQKAFGQDSRYAGGKSELDIARIIMNYRANSEKFLSIDYSSFDQTISDWLIHDAFRIIRSGFKSLKVEEEKLLDVIEHDFIHKDFIISEGIVHSDKGVPSGSMFTQIIDSLVNMLVVMTYFESINIPCKMMVMGDDNIIFTVKDVSIAHLASYVAKNFGLTVKVDDKSNEGICRRDDPKFLSRYWRKDGEYRHPYQLFSRLLFPERFRKYTNEVTPAHVVFAFILTYRMGMVELIDVPRFLRENPISTKDIWRKVDSRYLPGSLAYIRDYTVHSVG